MTGSKVCTNRGDMEVEEDGLIAAERDLVGPVPVRRCTTPSVAVPEAEGSLRQKEGFLDAEGSLLKPNRLVVVRIRRSGGFSNVFSSSGTSNARISPFVHFRLLTNSIQGLYRSSWLSGSRHFASAANQINDRDFVAKSLSLF